MLFEIQPDAVAADLIVDLYETDPAVERQNLGSLEIHVGCHPTHGRIGIFREVTAGRAVVLSNPHPALFDKAGIANLT